MPLRTFLLDQFNGLLGDGSHRDTRRAFFVHAFSLMGILIAAAFGFYHYAIGLEWMAAVDGAAAFVTVANQLWLRWRRNVAAAENVILGLFYVFLLTCLWGNVDRTGAYWFVLFPIAAFFLKSPRTAVCWVALMTLTLGAIVALQQYGIVNTGHPSRALVILAVVMLTLGIAVALYTAALNDAERRLQRKALRLSKEILERQSVEQTLRQAEEQLRFLAHHDKLTGLPTRALLYDRTDQAIALARRNHGRLALLLLDHDRFAQLNERYGHEAGDTVLKHTGKRMRAVLRQSDTISRIGGNRFAVVLMGVGDASAAKIVMEKLRAHLERPFRTVAGEPSVEVSIACALFPDDGEERDALLACAEQRLVQAKLDHYAPRLVEA